MACLLREPNSPFWYLKTLDPATGKWRRKATEWRVGVGKDTHQARAACAAATLRERQTSTASDGEEWRMWAEGYLKERVKARQQSELTLDRLRAGWAHVLRYLDEQQIVAPRNLTFDHCRAYLPWRLKQRRGKRPVAHNTALLEIKVLGIVMGEAVRRGMAAGNPCRELGIKKEKSKEKPALTDEQITTIREDLKTRSAWMSRCFEVALHHGCRVNECDVPMGDIDLDEGIIHFGKTKGGKPFTVPIHPGIFPVIEERIAAGAPSLTGQPANAALLWHKYFRLRLKMDVTFHSTRVTVATWMARDPTVPDKQAMRYLNHGSGLIHKLYQRWRASDVSGAAMAVRPPPRS